MLEIKAMIKQEDLFVGFEGTLDADMEGTEGALDNDVNSDEDLKDEQEQVILGDSDDESQDENEDRDENEEMEDPYPDMAGTKVDAMETCDESDNEEDDDAAIKKRVKALQNLRNEWLNLRKELQNILFSTDEKWQAERKKIHDLKEKHPFEPKDTSFSTTLPRIIKERPILTRDEAHIEKFQNIYKDITNCPKKTMDKVIAALKNGKGKKLPKETSMELFAVYALVIANRHHLMTQICQETSNTDGIADYIAIKLKRLSRKDPMLLPATDQMKKLMLSVIQEGRKTKIKKREEFNRTLQGDLLSQENIQALIKQGYDVIEVDTKIMSENRRSVKKVSQSDKHKIIQKNAIVIDKKTKKVLGVLCCDKMSQGDQNKTIEKIIKDIIALPPSYWEKDIRTGQRMKGKQIKFGENAINSGKQLSFGMNNFTRKTNKLTKAAKNKPKIWSNELKPFGFKLQSIFKELLPNTFQTALQQNEELRKANLCLNQESPFSMVTFNRKNAVKPHRDNNFNNYAAMVVYEIDGNKSQALTCFPEWRWKNPESQENCCIAFQVGHMGVLIADTDYIHYVPEVQTDRASLVWYTSRDLMTPSFLLCADSDLDDDDYEKDKSKEAGRQAKRRKTGAGVDAKAAVELKAAAEMAASDDLKGVADSVYSSEFPEDAEMTDASATSSRSAAPKASVKPIPGFESAPPLQPRDIPRFEFDEEGYLCEIEVSGQLLPEGGSILDNIIDNVLDMPLSLSMPLSLPLPNSGSSQEQQGQGQGLGLLFSYNSKIAKPKPLENTGLSLTSTDVGNSRKRKEMD